MTTIETTSRPFSTTPAAAHEHGWCVESRHATSTGQVTYLRCGDCGARRVAVLERGDLSPVAVSPELRPTGSSPAFGAG